jgi:hypothetical protein
MNVSPHTAPLWDSPCLGYRCSVFVFCTTWQLPAYPGVVVYSLLLIPTPSIPQWLRQPILAITDRRWLLTLSYCVLVEDSIARKARKFMGGCLVPMSLCSLPLRQFGVPDSKSLRFRAFRHSLLGLPVHPIGQLLRHDASDEGLSLRHR